MTIKRKKRMLFIVPKIGDGDDITASNTANASHFRKPHTAHAPECSPHFTVCVRMFQLPARSVESTNIIRMYVRYGTSCTVYARLLFQLKLPIIQSKAQAKAVAEPKHGTIRHRRIAIHFRARIPMHTHTRMPQQQSRVCVTASRKSVVDDKRPRCGEEKTFMLYRSAHTKSVFSLESLSVV